MSALDAALTVLFVKKLNTPFEKWPAFKHGIIDKNGNVLKQKATLRTAAENDAWGRLDIMICNIKKLLARLPGGQTRLATAAASIYLLKETRDQVYEEDLIEMIKLYEDAVVNNVGGGAIAAVGVPEGSKFGEPSPKKKARSKILKRLMPNVKGSGKT